MSPIQLSLSRVEPLEPLEPRLLLSNIEVTRVFQQGVNGYFGSADTHVRQDNAAGSFGSASLGLVDLDDNGASGNQPVQSLIGFNDLFGSAPGQIPVGSLITGASLTIYTGSNETDRSVNASSLHRMFSGWSEGSTWNSLSDGISANGIEAATIADGTVTPSTAGTAVMFNVTQTVQAWADNPAANHGWALLPSGDNMWRWNASEHSDVARRPSLTITYVPSGEVVNQPPAVHAGADQTITLPSSAGLDGSVTDDGLPEGSSVSVLWSQASGPGTASFGNATSVDTTASFSAAGTYVLRLTATDGELSASDEVVITVDEAISSRLLEPLQLSRDTGEKPQSKVWKNAGSWWGVFPNSSGTFVWRLDGTRWTRLLKLSSSTSTRADVLPIGNVTHVLLYTGTSSTLASIEYVPGTPGAYKLLSSRPGLASVNLSSGVETATVAMDGAGRMWIASDASTTAQVRYSDYPYSSWSAPITIGTNLTSDDIAAITSLPDGSVGVLWSGQANERFGFRTHAPGASPTSWTADEVPAAQSALDKGLGMADDHLSLAVASDGTVYAAVKTGYDATGYPAIALLIRRPNGSWDPLYTVDTTGTRGIVALNEDDQSLMVLYSFTGGTGSGDIVYKKTSLAHIAFGPRTTLMRGSLNNVSGTKQRLAGDAVFVAANTRNVMNGIRLAWPRSSAARTTIASAFSTSSAISTSEDDEDHERRTGELRML